MKCKCGCGKNIPQKPHHKYRPAEYLRGHYRYSVSKETREKQSKAFYKRTPMSKICIECKMNIYTKNGRVQRCKTCQIEYRKKYHQIKDKKRWLEMPEIYRKEKRNRARKKAIELREEVHKLLGDKCVKCGFLDSRALQIDHVYGDGYIDRKKRFSAISYYIYIKKELMKQSDRYQLLCANCNWIKRHEQGENARRYE